MNENRIIITFINRLDKKVPPLDVSILLDDHPAVNLWFERFVYELETGAMMRKEHLFMGTSPLSLDELINNINDTLDKIESWDFVKNQIPGYTVNANPKISSRISIDRLNDNDLLNLIHSYFPLLSGTAEKTSNYMYAASPEIRSYICRLNSHVHELHTLLQRQEMNNAGVDITVTWHHSPKLLPKLDPIFDTLFKKELNFGDVVLGYPQVGKTYFEAFIENDNELSEDNVEPIKLLSGEMMLHISSSIDKHTFNDFDKWLINRGLNPFDKSLRLGFARLGTIENLSIDLMNNIFSYNDIDLISIKNKSEKIKTYSFNYSRFDKSYNDLWMKHLDD